MHLYSSLRLVIRQDTSRGTVGASSGGVPLYEKSMLRAEETQSWSAQRSSDQPQTQKQWFAGI